MGSPSHLIPTHARTHAGPYGTEGHTLGCTVGPATTCPGVWIQHIRGGSRHLHPSSLFDSMQQPENRPSSPLTHGSGPWPRTDVASRSWRQQEPRSLCSKSRAPRINRPPPSPARLLPGGPGSIKEQRSRERKDKAGVQWGEMPPRTYNHTPLRTRCRASQRGRP